MGTYSYSTEIWTDKVISGSSIWQSFSVSANPNVSAVSAQLVSLGQVIRAHPGSRVTLRAQIKNTGSSALPSNAKVWFFVGGPLNSYVGSVSASGLAAGSSQWYSFPWSIPAHAPVATYYSYSTQVWTDKIISGFAIWQNFVVSLQ
jgi:subtilase family serine protease